MNCKIDFKTMMDEKFNDMLLNLNCGDEKSNEISRRMVEFANKYHIYGIEAMSFITDLFGLLTDLQKITETTKKGNNNEN